MKAAVYVQTNDAEANEVITYARGGDGRLERIGSYTTGGKGSGKPHLASQGSVVLHDEQLLVTNAGSDDVSLFTVSDDGLSLRDRVASGGSFPTSVTVHGRTVYVLNTGADPKVAGFELADARLARIDGAVAALPAGSDPAQVAFSPDGRTLVVTDRATNSIHVFAVDERGRVAQPVTVPSAGATPYGFDFREDGTLVVTEAAGAQVGKASASSYRVAAPGRVESVTGPVANTRSEVCWAVVSKDGRNAFVTNFGDGTISTYAIGDDGTIELRDAVAATTFEGEPGIRDEALSEDGRFLYALHADRQRIFAWAVGVDGTLAAVDSADGLPATAAGLAAG
jgi:6-phosphogluconolactonase (cycloisomerase 2 family)